MESREEQLKEKFIHKIRDNKEASKEQHNLIGIVHIMLVQAKGILPNESADAKWFCTVTLGKEERKSMIVRATPNPSWIKPMSLDWFESLDDYVELSLFDDNEVFTRNKITGRTSINLKELSQEVTHDLWLPLKNTETGGEMHVLVTITGTEGSASVIRSSQIESYHAGDVGHLLVTVVEAAGLQDKSLGKRQPFVTLELVNQRFQTRSREGIQKLKWDKEFELCVADIHTELQVTVCDASETPNHILGRVIIPLTHVQSGVRRWYRLKDKSLRKRAKGEDPKVLLEMTLSYNVLKAASKMFFPREVKYESNQESKLKLSTINFHLTRIRAVQARLTPPAKIIQEIEDILSWTSPAKTAGIAFGILCGIWSFEVWMLPVFLMGPFIFHLIRSGREERSETESVSEDENEEVEEGAISSVDGAALQQKAFLMQEYLGCAAHVLESFENVFNFSDPIVSWLVLTILTVSSVPLFLISTRTILTLLTTRLFTRRLYNPLPTNKLYNFMSRVHDKEQMRNFEELPAK